MMTKNYLHLFVSDLETKSKHLKLMIHRFVK